MGFGLGIIVILILVLSGLADTICRTTWKRFYYTRGITFFSKDFDFPYQFNIKRVDLLSKRENADKKFKSDIEFAPLAKNAIGFFDRPGKGGFGIKKRSYLSVLHGVMVYRDGKLTVAGIFDYFALLFVPAMMIAVTAYAVRLFKEGYYINTLILAALLVVFVVGFVVALRKQRARFIKIGDIMIGIGQKEKEPKA
ncbi:MAG: hypothetical protein J6W33_02035 [Spirochaetia bacterium]|nr:hypothetical protein [Spirochaetia bacterium]MBO7093669.1 hypothetical protein [Spirochaetia bacterium]MBO7516510.1 hypothetical protein [Spirochaetia bacterium]